MVCCCAARGELLASWLCIAAAELAVLRLHVPDLSLRCFTPCGVLAGGPDCAGDGGHVPP